ncbi:MAG: adenylate/guanylate cyclase domain-containing protein [Pseudomonadota bacterium]
MNAFREKLSDPIIARAAILWTCLVWTAVSGLTLLGAFHSADRSVQDLIARLSPASPAPGDILVVAIDAQSFAQFGDPWPWPRSRHAALLDAAHSAGAKAAVFDIVFDAQTDADPAFAAAIERFGPVILAAETALTATPQGRIETRSLPAPRLATAAAAIGDASLPLDGDGRLRRMPANAGSLAHATARALADPTSQPPAPDQFRDRFIPYAAPPFPPTVSYYQALAPIEHLPPGALAGKTLLIGLTLDANPTGRVTGDTILLPTHVNGAAPQPGIVAQAHVLAAALSGKALHRAPRPLERITGLAAALASLALIAAGLNSLPRLLAWGLAGALGTLTCLWIARSHGLVILAGPALSGWALAIAGQAAIIGGAALAAKRRLAAGFSRYVSPDLLKQILAQPDPPALGGEVRTVAVIVTDLAGFTALMDRLDPTQGASLLRDYLATLSAVILDHGGMIDQFIGDSIVALFNAPLEQADHARRTLDCIRALDQTAETFRQRHDGLGITRIGAAVGPAMVGNFGAEQRFHYTAMGDVVNTAARLEAANKQTGTRALITDALYTQAGAPEGFGPVQAIPLSGKPAPVPVRTLSLAPEKNLV